MRTYSRDPAQTFLKLRAPASAPFFFAPMQIGVAAALVGAVVAEVTKSEDGGLGARLLAGSYYGQTVQIWAALFAAAALSATLVGLIALTGRDRSRAHGVHPMNARADADLAPPLLFGARRAVALGSSACALFGVPLIILPTPSAIFMRLVIISMPTLAADFLQTIQRRARRLRDRLARRAGRGDPDRPLAVPAARPAAARQFRLGAADRRRRADHGDVVRLRLAVEGRGRGRHDLLPDAGQRRRRPGQRRRDGARSDEDLRAPTIGRRCPCCGCPPPRRSSSTR